MRAYIIGVFFLVGAVGVAAAFLLAQQDRISETDTFSTPGLDPLKIRAVQSDFWRLTPAPLLKVYKAFGETQEVAIYDTLASVKHGKALEYLYVERVGAVRGAGAEDIVLLHCVSGYSAPASDCNLATIPDMAARFGVMTALSDHTLDNTAAIAPVALGVVVIEKHVTLDRNGGGPNDSFSLEPWELSQLVQGTPTAWETVGRLDYGLKSGEQGNAQFGRPFCIVEDIPECRVLTTANARSIRPGFGLAPKHYDDILAHRAKVALTRGTALEFSQLL